MRYSERCYVLRMHKLVSASNGLENFRISLHALYQTFWNPWIRYIIYIDNLYRFSSTVDSFNKSMLRWSKITTFPTLLTIKNVQKISPSFPYKSIILDYPSELSYDKDSLPLIFQTTQHSDCFLERSNNINFLRNRQVTERMGAPIASR